MNCQNGGLVKEFIRYMLGNIIILDYNLHLGNLNYDLHKLVSIKYIE